MTLVRFFVQLFNQPISIKKHIIAITFKENPNFTWTCQFFRENKVFPPFIFEDIAQTIQKKDFHPMFFE
jgi:hypothetical protein